MAHIYLDRTSGWDERRRPAPPFRAGLDCISSACAALDTALASVVRRCRSPELASLYVSENCPGMCSEVGHWFRLHNVRGLSIVAAETHPYRSLTRITYEPLDGSRPQPCCRIAPCPRAHSSRLGLDRVFAEDARRIHPRAVIRRCVRWRTPGPLLSRAPKIQMNGTFWKVLQIESSLA